MEYRYDYENRLIEAVKEGEDDPVTVAYAYDPLGLRVEKRVTERDDGKLKTKITRYLYDNEDILFETDEKGKINNRYIHGPGIDEPLALIQGKETFYYHADGLGSIVALTDKSGKVVQDYQYDSFGNLKDEKNRIKQPYTYTGREYDRETGQYYYRARYYDAEAGRFTSKDVFVHNAVFDGKNCKIQKIISNQLALNEYIYANNNPNMYIDPTGLVSECKDCFQVFIDCMADTLIAPGWSNFTIAAGEAGGYFYTAKAWQHAASRNLIYPNKSYIARRLLNLGNKLPVAGMLLTFIAAEGICLNEEINCMGDL